MITGAVAYHLARRMSATSEPAARVTGEAIFGDGPYPRSFDDFVGQERARLQLMTAMRSAQVRGVPMDHILLASGLPGIGKTSLAKLVAYYLNVGYVELSGAIGEKDIKRTLLSMQEGDVLFIDEIHRMVSRGKAKAEWLLHLLQDNRLVLPTGVVEVPRITVIAATTDAQRLPETILGRFALKPILDPYTPQEAAQIAQVAAERLKIPAPAHSEWLDDIATAADCNPRAITMLLLTIRDLLAAGGVRLENGRGYDIGIALKWSGLSPDGLTPIGQDYLLNLLAFGGVAGLATLKAALNEEVLGHTERQLIQKGLIMVTPKGRELTQLGVERANALAKERGL